MVKRKNILLMLMFVDLFFSLIQVSSAVTIKTYNSDYDFVEIGYIPPTEIPDTSFNMITVYLEGLTGKVELRATGVACDGDGIIDSELNAENVSHLNLTYSGGSDCRFEIDVNGVLESETKWVRRYVSSTTCTKEYCDSDCKTYDVSYVCTEDDSCENHLIEDNCFECTNGKADYDEYTTQFDVEEEILDGTIIERDGYAINTSNNNATCDSNYRYIYSPNVCTNPHGFIFYNQFYDYAGQNLGTVKCGNRIFLEDECRCQNFTIFAEDMATEEPLNFSVKVNDKKYHSDNYSVITDIDYLSTVDLLFYNVSGYLNRSYTEISSVFTGELVEFFNSTAILNTTASKYQEDSTFNVYCKADGGAVDGWYISAFNGNNIKNVFSNNTGSADNETVFVREIGSEFFDGGENFSVACKPIINNISFDYGNSKKSQNYIINDFPTASYFSIDPSDVQSVDNLNLEAVFEDANNDILDIDFFWYRNNGSGYSLWSHDNESFTVSGGNYNVRTTEFGRVPNENTSISEFWKGSVRVSDGDSTFYYNTSEISIQESGGGTSTSTTTSSTGGGGGSSSSSTTTPLSVTEDVNVTTNGTGMNISGLLSDGKDYVKNNYDSVGFVFGSLVVLFFLGLFIKMAFSSEARYVIIFIGGVVLVIVLILFLLKYLIEGGL